MSTYTPIASVTLSSTQDSVVFSGIPQTYIDLVLVVSTLTNNTSADDVYLRFNSDAGSNYSQTGLRGNGSAASSSRISNQAQIFTTLTASAGNTTSPRTTIIQIMNYSNSTTNKTCLIRENIAGSQAAANVGLWRSTAAITTVLVSTGTGFDFASGSTFNLYGIDAQASAQAKATGGTTIIRDSSYWYHVFTSSGVFTPSVAITSDILVVAGGAGGSNYFTGGGGAGGLRVISSQSLAAQNYTVTIGAGGAGVIDNAPNSGSNSSLGSFSATGGGRGGRWPTGPGESGGSGGGGSLNFNAGGSGNAGGYTPAEGFAGGAGGKIAGNEATGGGGGAGGVGGASGGSGTTGGAGGIGATSATINAFGSATSTGILSGGNYYYAGGGGGGSVSSTVGAGGLGGGGAGGANGNGVSGTANTGGGAGGSAAENQGSNAAVPSGGSGIVIVRYAV